MHSLRVPATAKEKGNPLGAPAKKILLRSIFFATQVSPFSLCLRPTVRAFVSHLRSYKQSIKLFRRGFGKEIYSGFHYLGRKLELLKIRAARAKKDPVQHRKRYEKSSRTVSYRAAAGCAELPPVGSGDFAAEASRIFHKYTCRRWDPLPEHLFLCVLRCIIELIFYDGEKK